MIKITVYCTLFLFGVQLSSLWNLFVYLESRYVFKWGGLGEVGVLLWCVKYTCVCSSTGTSFCEEAKV